MERERPRQHGAHPFVMKPVWTGGGGRWLSFANLNAGIKNRHRLIVSTSARVWRKRVKLLCSLQETTFKVGDGSYRLVEVGEESGTSRQTAKAQEPRNQSFRLGGLAQEGKKIRVKCIRDRREKKSRSK